MTNPTPPRAIHLWARRMKQLALLSPLWVVGAPIYTWLTGPHNIFALIAAALVGSAVAVPTTGLFLVASLFAHSAVSTPRRTFRDIGAWLFAGLGVVATLGAAAIVTHIPW